MVYTKQEIRIAEKMRQACVNFLLTHDTEHYNNKLNLVCVGLNSEHALSAGEISQHNILLARYIENIDINKI